MGALLSWNLVNLSSRRMMAFLFYAVLGAIGGHVSAVFARRIPARRPVVAAQALVAASFIYVAFAMASMESFWLAIEIGGLLFFLAFAYLGLKRSIAWLWVGWATHILWDAGVHLLVATPFVPAWYPAACIGFDLVVAYHVYRIAAAPVGTAEAAA